MTSNIDVGRNLELYRSMLRIRLCEESFVEPILNREILCPVHLYTGEEAVAAGVCGALRKQDYVFGTHRSHGHYLAKGGSMKELVAEVYCRETGCSRGRGGSMHVTAPEVGVLGIAPIVGGTVALAAGAALAATIRGEDRVAVAFFGDGAIGEGVVTETMNFASLRRLPLIFACENNLYSTHMGIHEIRPHNNIVESGAVYGMESRRVDGNDVLAAFEVASEAVEICRGGKGPVLLEFMTYRLRGHVGPNDNIQGSQTDIRRPEEVAAWIEKDPVKRFRRFLTGDRQVKDEVLCKIEKECEQEVKEAHTFARASTFPDENGVMDYVFAK